MNSMKKPKKMSKYRIRTAEFKGYDDDGCANYLLKFNQSLQHTGRYNHIERGLNTPKLDEAKEEAKELLSDLSYVDNHNALDAVRNSLGRLKSIINKLENNE